MAQKCSPQRILVCLRAKLSKCVQQALCCFMRARGNDVGELLQFLANTNRERKTNPLNGDRSWSMFLAKSFCPAPSRNMQSQMRCHEALGRVEVQRLKLTFIKSHTCMGWGLLWTTTQMFVVRSDPIRKSAEKKIMGLQDTKPPKYKCKVSTI